jgi:putative membrane-bound dehydrogenase-like protein
MPGKPVLVAVCATVTMLLAGDLTRPALAQNKDPVPHGQDTMPGPPLTPAEAIKRMTVPEGFHVELVAAEPDIVNPVAMTFDERGRIWITESLEYPRHAAGPGRDRIKILESTKGDGKYDKITIFADGLNIPSGIAVGHGGVWVANSPDILFYKIGPDGKAAGKPEVVVTGFGRDDTHELPNSLTWGPDGWLYGLNGVFNRSRVKHKGKVYDFTCAMFRIHPRTKDFEIFCEGTSNPWGIAFDPEGSAFVSACVIDHLWHLVQTGYYVRQGGPYPPYTWPMGSIVKHRHQKAAYCGLHYFDSDAYPPEYRGKLYMGNIHGGCINCDELTRDGSTYLAKPRPDFLTAHDAWFMPVAQRTGPDGCLYILDWYDRYHCYQDAGRDPKGIDRERGRLYRVVYKHYRAAGKFDLAREKSAKLIERLNSPNIYFRDTAQRILAERIATRPPHEDAYQEGQRIEAAQQLQVMIGQEDRPRLARRHALWAAIAGDLLVRGEVGWQTAVRLQSDKDPAVRAWGVRLAGNQRLPVVAQIAGKQVPFPLLDDETVDVLINDPSPDVRLQLAIAARRVKGLDALPLLLRVLDKCGDDKLIPHIVWQNLHPLLEDRATDFLKLAEKDLPRSPNLGRLMPRAIERILGSRNTDPATLVSLITLVAEHSKGEVAPTQRCLDMLTGKIQTGELAGPRLEVLRQRLLPVARRLMAKGGPLERDAAFLAASLKDEQGLKRVRSLFAASEQPGDTLLKALNVLTAAGDASVLSQVAAGLADRKTGSPQFRGQMLAALGRLSDPAVADTVLATYPRMEPELQPRAVELLTQRPAWGKRLLAAIARKKLTPTVLNVNQVRRLLATRDAELVKQVQAHWGTVRDERNPAREQVVARMKVLLSNGRGDPATGWKVFRKVCAQCHKMYGEGVEVGPDITVNGRSSFDQLLSNVFDPSLVIGAGYQATTVVTTKGQVLTGLVAEDSAQRVVLKTQGGKLETIPRDEVEGLHVAKVSMMPEDLEKQLSPREIVDLFTFLTLDRPPGDPKARLIAGTPR